MREQQDSARARTRCGSLRNAAQTGRNCGRQATALSRRYPLDRAERGDPPNGPPCQSTARASDGRWKCCNCCKRATLLPGVQHFVIVCPAGCTRGEQVCSAAPTFCVTPSSVGSPAPSRRPAHHRTCPSTVVPWLVNHLVHFCAPISQPAAAIRAPPRSAVRIDRELGRFQLHERRNHVAM
jgi:hypothetical protein